jgi:hypothetical protein
VKTTVFVSYCHDDVKPDSGRLTVFLQELENAAQGALEVLVDTRHPRSAAGERLTDFVEAIRTVDAVIVLLSPGYRNRTLLKTRTGVYREFREIADRYLQSIEAKTYGRDFLLVPLLWTGDRNTSCPDEFKDMISRDLRWLQVIPNSPTPKLRRPIRTQLLELVREVCGRIEAIGVTKGERFKEREETLFRQFLFDDSKSRWNDPANRKYLQTAFVKTSAFLRARDRHVSFLIGRKGSGKSTIIHVLPLHIAVVPEVHLQLEFERFPLSLAFNLLRARPAAASDLRQVFSPLFSYQIVWDVFLHLCLGWHLRAYLPSRSPLRTYMKKFLEPKVKAAGDEAEANSIITATLFTSALERVADYIEKIIRQPGQPSEPLAGIVGDFHPSPVRRDTLGPSCWNSLQSVLANIKRRSSRVLITADGFDVISGYLRDSTLDPGEKEFERELLLALFQVVLNPGPARMGGGTLYEVSDFCIAMPFDRFAEARAIDRDRYQYRQRIAQISWSGMELSALVRKRLALLRQIRDAKGPDLATRLALVMERGYRDLPKEVGFQLGAANYRLPLFLYVLRHTLWRPRDVLHYYARLLAAAELAKRRREVLDSDFVRQVVAMATRYVVEDEILKEFEGYFPNLRDVLACFRRASQYLDWSQIQDRIGNVAFNVDLPADQRATLEWRTEVLYDLGILGISLSKEQAARLGSYRHAFSFNEGDVLREKLGRQAYRDCTFVLHPVFCEFLHLDTSSNPELVLPLDWTYLKGNEVLRSVAPP